MAEESSPMDTIMECLMGCLAPLLMGGGGGGNKKAVVVGINYANTQDELSGCLNDAKSVHQALVSNFGFPADNILMLLEDQGNPAVMPTKANIVNGLNFLLADHNAGDTLFFYFSGRGTRYMDTAQTLGGGLMDAICPIDARMAEWPANLITDRELTQMLQTLTEGVNFVCNFDCAHSLKLDVTMGNMHMQGQPAPDSQQPGMPPYAQQPGMMYGPQPGVPPYGQEPGMMYGQQPGMPPYVQEPGMMYGQQPGMPPYGQEPGMLHGQQPGMPYEQQQGMMYGQQPGMPYEQQQGMKHGQQPGMPYEQQQGMMYGQQPGMTPYAQQPGMPYEQQQQQPIMPQAGPQPLITVPQVFGNPYNQLKRPAPRYMAPSPVQERELEKPLAPGMAVSTMKEGVTTMLQNTNARVVALHSYGEEALLDNVEQGVFTWALLKALNENGHQMSYADLVTSASTTMATSGYQQTPQIVSTSEDLVQEHFLMSQ